MTEVPEHLLRRSRERRKALGLPVPGEEGDEQAAPAAEAPAAGEEPAEAPAAAAADAPAAAEGEDTAAAAAESISSASIHWRTVLWLCASPPWSKASRRLL